MIICFFLQVYINLLLLLQNEKMDSTKAEKVGVLLGTFMLFLSFGLYCLLEESTFKNNMFKSERFLFMFCTHEQFCAKCCSYANLKSCV